MKMSKTKILVVKDYANYCTELIGLLKDSGCFDVLPRVHDPRSVVDNVKENKPDPRDTQCDYGRERWHRDTKHHTQLP